MNTTEDNKILAEFIGYELNGANMMVFSTVPTIIGQYYIDRLQFHSSWDWLMPVVEKIESLDNKILTEYRPFDTNYSIIVEGYNIGGYPKTETTTLSTQKEMLTKIEATYTACVEFIKWYNQNNN